MRRRSIALPLAMLALFAVASVALAGGWAQVTAKNVPVDPPAGEETTIQIRVLQHGETPVSWPRLTVVATDAASGAVIRAVAVATGPEGSYEATLLFPTAGEWTLTYESVDLVMQGSATVRIANVAAPGAAAPVEAPAARAMDVLPQLIAVLAIFAVLAVGVLALRGRGTPADSPASARS